MEKVTTATVIDQVVKLTLEKESSKDPVAILDKIKGLKLMQVRSKEYRSIDEVMAEIKRLRREIKALKKYNQREESRQREALKEKLRKLKKLEVYDPPHGFVYILADDYEENTNPTAGSIIDKVVKLSKDIYSVENPEPLRDDIMRLKSMPVYSTDYPTIDAVMDERKRIRREIKLLKKYTDEESRGQQEGLKQTLRNLRALRVYTLPPGYYIVPTDSYEDYKRLTDLRKKRNARIRMKRRAKREAGMSDALRTLYAEFDEKLTLQNDAYDAVMNYRKYRKELLGSDTSDMSAAALDAYRTLLQNSGKEIVMLETRYRVFADEVTDIEKRIEKMGGVLDIEDEVGCSICDSPADLVCSNCNATAYCGPDCQAADWDFHKTNCL